MFHSTRKTDHILVAEAQAASSTDHRAFEELVVRYQNHVATNCRCITHSADSEDLAQEVFVKVFFGLKKFQARAAFKTWLRKVKINHCLNYNRKRNGKAYINYESNEAQTRPEFLVNSTAGTGIDKLTRRQQIQSILDSMSDTLRIPLILCDLDGLCYQEAANELGIGLSALKMRLKRAREYFRKQYRDYDCER